MKNLILILFIILLTPSFAQQEGVVVVTILDSKSNRPLPLIVFKIKEMKHVSEMTVKELKVYCKKHEIRGYSKLKKAQILSLIEKRQLKKNLSLSW